MEVVASLSQGRTAAAQCGLFTHKSVPVIFEPPCSMTMGIYTYLVGKWRQVYCISLGFFYRGCSNTRACKTSRVVRHSTLLFALTFVEDVLWKPCDHYTGLWLEREDFRNKFEVSSIRQR